MNSIKLWVIDTGKVFLRFVRDSLILSFGIALCLKILNFVLGE